MYYNKQVDFMSKTKKSLKNTVFLSVFDIKQYLLLLYKSTYVHIFKLGIIWTNNIRFLELGLDIYLI